MSNFKKFNIKMITNFNEGVGVFGVGGCGGWRVRGMIKGDAAMS